MTLPIAREVCDDIDDIDFRLDRAATLSIRDKAELAVDVKVRIQRLACRARRSIEWDEIEHVIWRLFTELLLIKPERAVPLVADEMEWLRNESSRSAG